MILVLIVAPMMIAQATPPAENQCEPDFRTLEAAKRERLPSEVDYSYIQLTAVPSLCGGWTVIDFGWHRQGQRRSLVMRRQVLDSHRPVVGWLNSERCPRALKVLAKLDDMSIKIGANVRRTHPVKPFVPMIHGTEYTLTNTGARQGGGPSLGLIISGNQGPIADWAKNDLSTLADCWRPTLD